jgi:hypothetical protein
MIGALIQTHLAAQIWDGRAYRLLSGVWRFAFGSVLALAGFLLGYGWFRKDWLLGILPMAAYVVADIAVFAWLGVVLPFAASALAWVSGVLLGRLTATIERRRLYSQSK